jgi:hypothetical protein
MLGRAFAENVNITDLKAAWIATKDQKMVFLKAQDQAIKMPREFETTSKTKAMEARIDQIHRSAWLNETANFINSKKIRPATTRTGCSAKNLQDLAHSSHFKGRVSRPDVHYQMNNQRKVTGPQRHIGDYSESDAFSDNIDGFGHMGLSHFRDVFENKILTILPISIPLQKQELSI